MSVTAYAGTGGVWAFQETWYDGGKNKVLYQSGDYQGKTKVCAPVKKLAKGNRVYDHIIVFNGGAGVSVTEQGTYTINNY